MFNDHSLGKTPLEDRIHRFVTTHPEAKYVPLHPDDWNAICDSGNAWRVAESAANGLPLRLMGSGGDA